MKESKPKTQNPPNRPKPQKKQRAVQRKTATSKNRLRKRDIDEFPLGMPQGSGFPLSKSIVVTQDEYIAEMPTQGTNFAVNYAFSINPGLAATFPWLSTVAAQYEKYVFEKLEFYYKPEVTQYSANVNTGKVIVSCDYDAADSVPTSKKIMEDTEPHADGMPYQTLTLKLSPRQLHQLSVAKFIRTANNPVGTDIKTYDGGVVYFATQGQASGSAGSILGEVRVRYSVRLLVPVLNPPSLLYPNRTLSQWEPEALNVVTGLWNIMDFSGGADFTGNGIQVYPQYFTIPTGRFLVDVDAQVDCTGAYLIEWGMRIRYGASVIAQAGNLTPTPAQDGHVHISTAIENATADPIQLFVDVLVQFSTGTTQAQPRIRFLAV